ncbi:hypothetical protein LCGC14_0878450 [marine sediment metagenome]|uniref:Uncharacterized protein n=1 Tax=marine sediment metagenome TaxID=412755 RepID=A0A0F9P2M7_9ZZZZ
MSNGLVLSVFPGIDLLGLADMAGRVWYTGQDAQHPRSHNHSPLRGGRVASADRAFSWHNKTEPLAAVQEGWYQDAPTEALWGRQPLLPRGWPQENGARLHQAVCRWAVVVRTSRCDGAGARADAATFRGSASQESDTRRQPIRELGAYHYLRALEWPQAGPARERGRSREAARRTTWSMGAPPRRRRRCRSGSLSTGTLHQPSREATGLFMAYSEGATAGCAT